MKATMSKICRSKCLRYTFAVSIGAVCGALFYFLFLCPDLGTIDKSNCHIEEQIIHGRMPSKQGMLSRPMLKCSWNVTRALVNVYMDLDDSNRWTFRPSIWFSAHPVGSSAVCYYDARHLDVSGPVAATSNRGADHIYTIFALLLSGIIGGLLALVIVAMCDRSCGTTRNKNHGDGYNDAALSSNVNTNG